jgi:hypothetical protein
LFRNYVAKLVPSKKNIIIIIIMALGDVGVHQFTTNVELLAPLPPFPLVGSNPAAIPLGSAGFHL